VHDLRDKISGVAESATDTARSAANRLTEKAKAAGAAFGDMAGDAQSRMSSAYDGVSRTASGAAASGRGLFDFVREQPLVLAGIGLAIGAALGAAVPVTRTENELMGEKADELKERMGEMASEQYDKAQEVVGSAYEHAKKEAEQKFGLQAGQEPGGVDSGRQYKSAEMSTVTENVTTAPTGNENPAPQSDETAQRQEELGFAEPKPNR
jgi:ElaB/YqjD/DUF883 family membrane-anchored ribosome-binding protein